MVEAWETIRLTVVGDGTDLPLARLARESGSICVSGRADLAVPVSLLDRERIHALS
jgi:hypothetical protein